jgi:hypothetical protein
MSIYDLLMDTWLPGYESQINSRYLGFLPEGERFRIAKPSFSKLKIRIFLILFKRKPWQIEKYRI